MHISPRLSKYHSALGQWERLDFPNPPTSRYGMASASSIGSGLYIFGGFGMQGSSSSFNNPYIGYGASGLASYKQSPAVPKKQKRAVSPKQNFNQGGYSNNNNNNYNYNNNEDRVDENFYALPDAWFLNYA